MRREEERGVAGGGEEGAKASAAAWRGAAHGDLEVRQLGSEKPCFSWRDRRRLTGIHKETDREMKRACLCRGAPQAATVGLGSINRSRMCSPGR